jgi:hypothetical protein
VPVLAETNPFEIAQPVSVMFLVYYLSMSMIGFVEQRNIDLLEACDER